MNSKSVLHSCKHIDHSKIPSIDAAEQHPFCVVVIVPSAFAETSQPVSFATLLPMKRKQSTG